MFDDLTHAFLRFLEQCAGAPNPHPVVGAHAGAPIFAPALTDSGAIGRGPGFSDCGDEGFTLDEIVALSDALKRRSAPRGASASGHYR